MDKQTEDRFAMSRDILSRPGPSDYNVKQIETKASSVVSLDKQSE